MNIEDQNKIKTLYLEGKTITEITKIINTHRTVIRKYLIKLNIYDSKRDYGLNVKYDYNNLDLFHNIDTEEKAYWLGFIFADGHLDYTGGYSLKIELSKLDEKHLQKLSNIFNKPIKDSFKKSTNKNYALLCVHSKQLYNDLINHGIENNKTYASITTIFEYIPKNLLVHFIRGYFDGDGHIGYLKTNIRACYFHLVGIPDFLTKLRDIMEKEIHVAKRSITVLKNGVVSILQYNKHDDIISIYNWLYNNSNVYLDRKKDKFEIIMHELCQI